MTTTPSGLVWNVRGLNDRARRCVIRDLLLLHRPSFVCFQETKLAQICNATALEMLGPNFDYDFVPSVGVAGGILLAWCTSAWSVLSVVKGRFSISARVQRLGSEADCWWLTGVYGP
jgi:hypothetical protein